MNMKKRNPKPTVLGSFFHIALFHNVKLLHRGEKCIGFSVGVGLCRCLHAVPRIFQLVKDDGNRSAELCFYEITDL